VAIRAGKGVAIASADGWAHASTATAAAAFLAKGRLDNTSSQSCVAFVGSHGFLGEDAGIEALLRHETVTRDGGGFSD